MTLTLHVDETRWRAHLRRSLRAQPDLVPVTKGNGYGFGNARLAAVCTSLGVDVIAVGTYPEAAQVSGEFDGDILVLTPWRPNERAAEDAGTEAQVQARPRVQPKPGDATATTSPPRLIHTVSRVQDLRAIGADSGAPVRVVLERATSMLRHGMSARELREAAAVVRAHRGIVVEGIALHLPLGARGNLNEVERLMQDVVAAGLAGNTVWVSHLSDTELRTLHGRWSDYRFRPRVGTALWLGERAALRTTATVLDVHPVERGDIYGYRGRTAPRAGTIVVVSGGTAHGIGLESPTGSLDLRSRAATFARGGLDAAGLVRSPFIIDGKHPLFAEPPHMQASMLFLPVSARVPDVGEEIAVRCRFTTTAFDRVELA